MEEWWLWGRKGGELQTENSICLGSPVGRSGCALGPGRRLGSGVWGVKVRMVWEEAGEVPRCVIFFFGKWETVEDHMPTGT